MPARVDLNNPEFQHQWLALDKEGQLAVLQCVKKISSLEWQAIYRDKGLRWEPIQSRAASDGSRLYAIRISGKIRAVVKRTGDYIQFLSLHADHDSAY